MKHGTERLASVVKYHMPVRKPNGREYHFYRRIEPKTKKPFTRPLPHPDHVAEFWRAYHAARDEYEVTHEGKRREAVQPAPAKKRNLQPGPERGTIADYCDRYRGSNDFRSLKPSTQNCYHNRMTWLAEDYGNKRIADITSARVAEIRKLNPRKPYQIKGVMKMLNVICGFAVEEGGLENNPCTGIKQPKWTVTHYPAWPLDQIEAFRACWPVGTKQRLALEMGLNAGQRISDAMLAKREHFADDKWRVTSGEDAHGTGKAGQVKTGNALTIPLLSSTKEALDALPYDGDYLLGTPWGKRSPKSAAQWFRSACNKAEVSKTYSYHGLRSSCAVRLKEAGLPSTLIMAITGHRNERDLQTYVRDAEQEMLAEQAIDLLEAHEAELQTSR